MAFGLKNTGKFYHFYQGKAYDEIKGSNKHAVGELKGFSAMVYGRYNEKVFITGGMKNGQYSDTCLSFEFDIKGKSLSMKKIPDLPLLNKPRYGHSNCIISPTGTSSKAKYFVLFGQHQDGQFATTIECINIHQFAKAKHFIELPLLKALLLTQTLVIGDRQEERIFILGGKND